MAKTLFQHFEQLYGMLEKKATSEHPQMSSNVLVQLAAAVARVITRLHASDVIKKQMASFVTTVVKFERLLRVGEQHPVGILPQGDLIGWHSPFRQPLARYLSLYTSEVTQ
eukprot:GABV01000760.1.p2 GENE.GABV01000760.1~~GABV01000760.1.p2  ORF type:complete len:111 (+),score=23.07 GABV01000760.1:587-919(+)